PDRDASRATGTCRARPALTYMRASNIASGPSKSAASHQHLSPSSSGYKPRLPRPALRRAFVCLRFVFLPITRLISWLRGLTGAGQPLHSQVAEGRPPSPTANMWSSSARLRGAAASARNPPITSARRSPPCRESCATMSRTCQGRRALYRADGRRDRLRGPGERCPHLACDFYVLAGADDESAHRRGRRADLAVPGSRVVRRRVGGNAEEAEAVHGALADLGR